MSRAALALAALALGPGCLTPPALFEVHGLERQEILAQYPPGTALVEVPFGDAALRGYFVPAGLGAPVVLHFLGSGASVVSPFGTPAGATDELAGLGFASWVADYAGVGASTGERDVRRLAEYAHACWDAALAFAGGDARRVHVRANSIGTLAVAALIADGIRPASLVLIAPVTPTSVVSRGAAALYGDPAGVLAELLFRPVGDAALASVLPDAAVPTLVLSPESDAFLWDRERAALRVAVERGAGRWRDFAMDHVGLSALATCLLPEEEAWWSERADPEKRDADARAVLGELAPEERARFDADPIASERLAALSGFGRTRAAKDVAAAALADSSLALAMQSLHAERGQHAELDLADTTACYSSDAPVRPIDALEMRMWSALLEAAIQGGIEPDRPDAEWWRIAGAVARGEPVRLTYALRGPDGGKVTVVLRPRAMPARSDDGARDDDVRRTAQILLRAARRPHRARRDADGAWRLEIFRSGAWVEIGPRSGG